ncbi:hypothetical protein PCI56_17910 [Plesiomonas shigelloides subsp. oncorhynchi]|nr:hypothetical protein [Plesiomonas shigelloides]
MRKPVNFHFEQQDTLKLREYLASIPKPNSQREFLVEPHDMRGLIAMDGDLLFFMADLFFGGKGTSTRRRSEMSDTELRLVERIFRQLLEQFDDCWRNQTSWYSQMTQQQSLHLNNSMANQPLFQICRFSIQIGEHLGWLEIALPFNGLEFYVPQRRKRPTSSSTRRCKPRWKSGCNKCRCACKPPCAKNR